MAQQTINTGAAPDDGSGDSLRTGGIKINQNFDELYELRDLAAIAGQELTLEVDAAIISIAASDVLTVNGSGATVDGSLAATGNITANGNLISAPTAANTDAQIVLTPTGTGDSYFSWAGDFLRFSNDILFHSTGNASIGDAADPGVKLGVTGAIAATTGVTVASGQTQLSNYLEGTYTATLTPTTSGSITLDVAGNTLSYTRVGDRCYIQGTLTPSAVSSPLGSLTLSLPFTSASALVGDSDMTAGAIIVENAVSKNANAFALRLYGNSSSAFVITTDSVGFGSAATQFQYGEVVTQMYVSFHYQVA